MASLSSVNVNISGITVRNCKRYKTGTALNSGSGGALRVTSASIALSDVVFSNNYAEENGGAVYIDSISATFSKLAVKDNTALGNGGGIYLNNGQLTLTQNSDVDSNTLFVVRVVSRG